MANPGSETLFTHKDSNGNSDKHAPFLLQYRLARTVVKIDGTVATQAADSTGASPPTITSTVSLAVEADPSQAGLREVEADGGYFASASFNLSLAPDGRLAGAGDTVAGVGGELVSAGLNLATTVAVAAAKVVPLLDIDAPKGAADEPKTAEERYARDQPDAATRRKAIEVVVSALENTLAALLAQAAESPSKDVGAELTVVERGLAVARAEATSLAAAFESWRSTTYPTSTEAFSDVLGTDELPAIPIAEETLEFPDLKPGASRVAEVLHTVVAIVGDAQAAADEGSGSQSPVNVTDELMYRIPRRVHVAVYKAGADSPSSYRLQSVAPAWIIDKRSELAKLPLHCGLFQKRSMTVAFGEAGTLTQLSNSDTPAISGIASALGGAASQVAGAVENATKLAAALPAPPADPDLKALEQQVTRKELEARLATAAKTISGGGSSAKAT